MRKRPTKWLLLLALAMSTLFVGCPASVGLQILDSMISGVYSSAQGWAADVALDLLQSLERDE